MLKTTIIALFAVLTGVGMTSQAASRSVPSRECRSLGDNCYSDTFLSPAIKQTPLDLLFVVDTSESMNQEMPAIRASIANFIGSLPNNTDINVAVMLSHGSTSGWSGRLFQASSDPTVLKGKVLTHTQMQTYINMKLASLVQDAGSAGGEEGLFSLFNGITNSSLLSESQAAGFFRSTAALAVVLISDDRDICAVPPQGVPAETDPVKIAARIRDCEGLTAQGLGSRLQQLKGTQSLYVSGIIYSQNPVPAGDNEVGYGLTNLIQVTQGSVIEIGRDDISAKLRTLIAPTGIGTTAEFTLSHSNIDASSVTVTANGKSVAFTLSGNKVTLKEVLPAGTIVIINYCLKSNNLSSKAEKLAAIMTMSCPIPNKSYPKNYVAPSSAEIANRLRACTPDVYPETPTTVKQQKTLDQLLNVQDSSLRQKMFRALWYHPPKSDDFEYYFGLSIDEAVSNFCLNRDYLPEQLYTTELSKVQYGEGYDAWKANPTAQKRWNFAQMLRRQIKSCLNK